MDDPTVITALIAAISGIVGLTISGVFSYLNTRNKDRNRTLPVITPIDPKQEAAELREALVKARANYTQRLDRYRELLAHEQQKFLAAMDWGERLTKQVKRLGGDPADYIPPNGGESEPHIPRVR